MKEKLPLLLLFCGLFFMILPLQAQLKTISGVIRNEEGIPLEGVSVTLKSTSKNVLSDASGKYTIQASVGDVLTFSYVGLDPVEMKVTSATSLHITLRQKSEALSDVVVVGYGTQRRSNLTGAVATVDVKRTLQSRPITDLARGLQGAVAGLTITTPSGDIGTNPAIRLRGLAGSLNGGGATPLILVDNVEFPDLRMLNPDDIESISVLKDAASVSIYGTRAAWGVVLITTKTGKRGGDRMRVTYSSNFSFARPTTTPEIAEAVAGAEMAMEANKRASPNTTQWAVVGAWYDAASVQKMKDWQTQYGGQHLGDDMVLGRDFEIRGSQLFFFRPWNATKMFMREWMPQQTHNLSISGGGEKTAYTLGLGYLGQKGVLQANPDKFERFNVNFSLNSSVSKWLDIHTKLILSRAEKTSPFLFSSATYDPWYYVTRWPAFYPYGTYDGKPFRSAITEVQQAKMVPRQDNIARLQLGGTFKVAKGVTIDATYTYANSNMRERQTGGSVTAYNFWAFNGLGYSTYTGAQFNAAIYTSAWDERNAARAYATYSGKIKDHEFKVTVGTDVELYQYYMQRTERRGLLNPDMGEPNLATGDQFAGSSRSHWSTLGYVGRLNYSYKNKYLLEVNGRYDGSSSFPVNNRWAVFPSFSVGYKLSEESFMNFAKPFLSSLKLRGSWGSVGNQSVGGNRFLSIMNASASNWIINGVNTLTTTTPGLVSSALSWERVSTFDIGLDARFLDNKLGVSFDWYKRTTSDMITAGLTVPSTLGTGAPAMNFGEMQTKGWELTVDWNHRFANGIQLNVMGVLSDFQEEITKFPNSTRAINSNYEGKKLGEIWGFHTDRFFNENDFERDASGNFLLDASGRYIMKSGIATQRRWEAGWFFYGPGDIKYQDLDGDGKIDIGSNTVGDAGDQRIIGNSTPRYQYGLRIGAEWKGFDVNLYIQGVGKRDYWANGPVFIPGFRPGEGWFQHQLDYWTPQNTSAFYPRPTDQGQSNSTRNFLPQTKYLLNMAYTRLKNINIGYSLPQKVVQKIRLSNVRFYLSGENLLTFDRLSIPIDPEIDYTPAGLNDASTFGRVYPYQKSFSFGVQVNF